MYYFCSILLANCEARGDRKHSALSDEAYDIVIQLIRGQFHKPKCNRTLIERNAVRYFYRYRQRLGYQDQPQPALLIGKNIIADY